MPTDPVKGYVAARCGYWFACNITGGGFLWSLNPPGHRNTVGPEVVCFKFPVEWHKVWPLDSDWDCKNLLKDIFELGLYDSYNICRHIELVVHLRAAARAYLVDRINNH